MKVVCNHSAVVCDERCSHKYPHDPIMDTYPVDDDELGQLYLDGLCSEIASACEMAGGFSDGTVRCVPCEDKRHKNIPALPGIGD